ncbi:MAG: gfo/Idh/MocA family oxidoreductase, partial [Selenomonadaceae bacterium]|nr:gfo/Idh/MocA family oxidoreductase [Selenomonadaceae bacterium]
AVTPLHSRNFVKIRELLPTLGRLRAVQANYSQYSRRYDRYLAGEVLPAFDPTKFGGALLDINIYNLNVIIGLFGEPQAVEYAANIGFNGVDTSGVVLMRYDGFMATALGAKDSESPGFIMLQGERGWLRVNGAPNEFKSFDVSVGGSIEHYELNRPEHRMVDEFEEFASMYAARDFEQMSRWLDVSIAVMRTAERAKKSLEAD